VHHLHGVPAVKMQGMDNFKNIDAQQTKMINNLNNVKQKLFKTIERFGSTMSVRKKHLHA
jgi:L-serine deaminase